MASRAKGLGVLLAGGLLFTGCAALDRATGGDGPETAAYLSEERCPMDVPDTRVSTVPTEDGFALAFETSEADAVPALRDRVALFAASVEEEAATVERFTAQEPGAQPEGPGGDRQRLNQAERMDFEAGDARADTPHRLSGELVPGTPETRPAAAPALPAAVVGVQSLPAGAQVLFEPRAEGEREELGRQLAARAEQMEPGRCPSNLLSMRTD